MTSFEGEATRIINKFNIYKFKIEMLLASMDLYDIVDKHKKPLPFNTNPNLMKKYQRHVKKAMSIIGLNLADNQLVHIKSCKGFAEAWKTLCNIHETKTLSNILFICRKCFTWKMQEGNGLLDHVNKVRVFADQFVCLKIPVRHKNIVMILFESLPTLFEYLITAGDADEGTYNELHVGVFDA